MIPALVPLLITIAPAIIQGVEKLFGAKTGATKKQVATDMLGVATDQLSKAGVLQGVADKPVLEDLVEIFVQIMKGRGELGAGSATTSTIAGTIPANAATPTIANLGNGPSYRLEGTVRLVNS